jgi:hypothetical protein
MFVFFIEDSTKQQLAHPESLPILGSYSPEILEVS